MKFYVYSRRDIEALESHPGEHVIVSIQTPGDPNLAKLPEGANTKGVLRLVFHDIDVLSYPAGHDLEVEKETLFHTGHAREILDFMDAHAPVEHFVVHCDAGRSRSPAVAAAVCKIYDESHDDREFFAQFTPNRHIWRTILDEHERRLDVARRKDSDKALQELVVLTEEMGLYPWQKKP